MASPGASYYDSNLGRWLTPDPLADKYPGWSPYNYTLNNPMKYIDPDGNDPILTGAAVAVAAGTALGVGITLYATYEVTKNYLENPGSVNMPNQSTVMGVALGYANSVYNTVNSWFSSEEKSSTEKNQTDNSEANQGKNTGFKEQVSQYSDKSLKKAQKNLGKSITEHEAKIKNDPKSKAVKHWENEIKTWKEQQKIVQQELNERGSK